MSVSTKKLAGKVAVVTGASKGIGAGIAKQLAADGAAVVVNYASSKEGAQRIVDAITTSGGKAIAVQGDVSKPADIKRLFAETKKSLGRLDILVNNAGVYAFLPLEAVTMEEFNRQFGLNVAGLLLATQEAVKLFPDAGGSVINIGSVAGKNALAQTSIYSATKSAVDSITRTLAAELGPKRIRVNAVNPGLTITEGVHSAGINADDNAFFQKTIADTPLGRAGTPEDIAPVVSFLASEDARWITGETIYVSGGLR